MAGGDGIKSAFARKSALCYILRHHDPVSQKDAVQDELRIPTEVCIPRGLYLD
jgi:hypothetical protein